MKPALAPPARRHPDAKTFEWSVVRMPLAGAVSRCDCGQECPLEKNPTPHRLRSVRQLSLVILIFLLSLLVAGEVCAQSTGQHSSRISLSMPTELRVESTLWWPTKGSAARQEYAGSGACARCHAEKAASQAVTSMARASMRPSDSQPLKSHPDLRFNLGAYEYELVTKDGPSLLSVTQGADSTTKNLEWAVGDSNFGQSYVYRENGKYYEAQLSYYTVLNGLDVTTGHSRALPRNAEVAAGGYTPPATIRECFGCHFTGATMSNQFDPDQSMMGVSCEACHGPGVTHVALMASGALDAKGLIMNPAALSPVDSVDFCGACHRTYADVVLQGLARAGVINARMQPYRLEKSKCWGRGDARITCVACHDPHAEVTRDAAFYDSKCLRCHQQRPHSKPLADHPGKACRVSTKDCVTCHMPKVEVLSTHANFTDHWIRIAHAGEPYPE
jgi:hypothetical protein